MKFFSMIMFFILMSGMMLNAYSLDNDIRFNRKFFTNGQDELIIINKHGINAISKNTYIFSYSINGNNKQNSYVSAIFGTKIINIKTGKANDCSTGIYNSNPNTFLHFVFYGNKCIATKSIAINDIYNFEVISLFKKIINGKCHVTSGVSEVFC